MDVACSFQSPLKPVPSCSGRQYNSDYRMNLRKNETAKLNWDPDSSFEDITLDELNDFEVKSEKLDPDKFSQSLEDVRFVEAGLELEDEGLVVDFMESDHLGGVDTALTNAVRKLLGEIAGKIQSSATASTPPARDRPAGPGERSQLVPDKSSDKPLPCNATDCEKDNRRMCEFLFLSLVALWLTADTIVDWLFLRNVIHVQPGLVLGPVDPNIQISMTSFCILGTLGWIMNMTNLFHQCWMHRQFFSGDIVQAITIWAKNVPQILISNLIASCQEVAVSYYQVVKAGMLLVSHVSLGVILLRKCYKTYETMSYSDTVLKVIISIGLLFAMTGSLGVLLLVHISPVDEFGYVVTFKTPRGDVDMEGYFEDIGIYYKHPTLQCHNEPNWINLASIFDVTDAGRSGFQVTYHHVPHNHTSLFYVEKRSPYIHYKYCYIQINQNCTIHKLFRCPRRLRPPEKFTTVTMKFRYLLPDSRRLFGNIVYDMVTKTEKSCKTMSGSYRGGRKESRFGQLRYFQVMPYLTSGMRLMPLLFKNTSTHRSDFYRPRDLIDVRDVWRTGIMACNTTGRVAPDFQGSLGLMC